jgi:Kef-type K+ transport system membrane component KefB
MGLLRLGAAVAVLALMIVGWPYVFRLFTRLIPTVSLRTEFGFVVVVALTCAFVTRLLGAYYLVGAFVVGLVTQQIQRDFPERFGARVMDAIELFGAFFITFYFFKAGLHIERDDISLAAVGAGFALLVVAVPLRIASVVVQRRVMLSEAPRKGARIAVNLLPTLVFTLVIAEILDERFGVPEWLFGGLIFYAVANTVIPAIVFGVPASYDDPHTLAIPPGSSASPDHVEALPPRANRADPAA